MLMPVFSVVKRRLIQALVVSIGLYFSITSVWALSIASLEVPPDTTVAWVADDLVHNGIPMQIQVLRSERSVESVLSFYRELWTPFAEGEIPGYVENQVGEWFVISALNSGSSLVVQVKPGKTSTTEGFISQIDPNRGPNPLPVLKDIPLPEGSTLMSTSSSEDRIQSSVTAIVVNQIGVAENTRFFRANMKRRGWTYSTGSTESGVSVLLFSRRDGSSEISINSAEDGSTILMINRSGH